MTTRRLLCAAAACLAVSAFSLLLADEPVYDAWSWLVWGRELAALGIDTTTGPSWKPLPVLVAVPLSLAGGAGPDLWLVLVRAAYIMALVLAAELAVLLAAGCSRALRAIAAVFAVAV